MSRSSDWLAQPYKSVCGGGEGGNNLVRLSFEEKHFDYNLCDDVQELELATNKIIFMR